MHSDSHDWAIVLAVGHGSRLRSLASTAGGVPVPKQFCLLRGGVSRLQESLRRAESLTARERVCTVVAREHRASWSEPLGVLPAENILVQPRHRGTAIDVLLPLLRLARRDPRARVTLLPADHFVRNEAVLLRSLRAALTDVAGFSDEVLLLGIRPEDPDPGLGYIVPAAGDGTGLAPVARLVEKPGLIEASQLVARGAAWNSFIVVARLESLLGLYERRFPEVVTAFDLALEREALGEQDAVDDLYDALPDIDFARHLLPGQERHLRMLAVPACGWSEIDLTAQPYRLALAG
jgi:mannose-1-phosphate guanylyltransferase